MDAFAVALAQGAARRVSSGDGLKIGAAFGFAQGIMPFIGWLVGVSFYEAISAFDHWIALILLCALGIKMLWEAFGDDEGAQKHLSGAALFVAAVATSIDALAAGITLPTLGVPAVITCIAIGVITAILSYIGVLLGGVANARIGKWAEVTGGIVLIGLGIKIFAEHVFFGLG